MQSDWEHRSCRHRLGRQSQGRSGSQAWSCAHCALCWWWRGPHAGRLPEKTKITIIIKHLSTHISIFSIAMALENVQNRFFGLKTVKVVLKQVFQWEKGQISPLPLETQLTYLNRELLPISLNKDWLAILRLNHLKWHKLANKDCHKLSTSTSTTRLEECLFSWHPLHLQRHWRDWLLGSLGLHQYGFWCHWLTVTAQSP